ncbi:MAG: hypothetical protein U9R16_09165, partial [Campylobacterota bacterium]|nr:hypothetical protein [Campylobacterota bacterium]
MKIFIGFTLSFFIFLSSAYAITDKDKEKKFNSLTVQLTEINSELEDNIWITRYYNYLTYRKIEKELVKIKQDAKKYGRWKDEKFKELSYQLYNKIKIKENELELISEYKDSPIGKRIKPVDIAKTPEITNPFIIIEALSYIQLLKENLTNYSEVNSELVKLLAIVQQKIDILEEINKIDDTQKDKINKELKRLKLEVKDFKMVVDIVSTTLEVYDRKIVQITQEVHDSISDEIWRTIKLLILVFFFLLVSFGLKIGLKKYIQDDDRQYTTN